MADFVLFYLLGVVCGAAAWEAWQTVEPKVAARWRERQRKADREILWPICVKHADGNIQRARQAFAWHCYEDPAYDDMTKLEIQNYVDNLEADA